MSTPFLGEVKIFSFSFPPKGWAFCNGQLLAINQNQALFALLGTQYGGNGQTNFALPNLQSRVPIHFGTGFNQGQAGGEEAHTLTGSEMPQHNHLLSVSNAAASTPIATSNALGLGSSNVYATPGTLTAMAATTVTAQGGSQPHPNLQPYLVLNFCIALQGIFPSRN
jgi:microcystin-dependent protein